MTSFAFDRSSIKVSDWLTEISRWEGMLLHSVQSRNFLLLWQTYRMTGCGTTSNTF